MGCSKATALQGTGCLSIISGNNVWCERSTVSLCQYQCPVDALLDSSEEPRGLLTNTPACFRVVIDGVFFTDTQIQLCIYRNCMELFKDYNNTSLPFKRRTIVEKIQRF